MSQVNRPEDYLSLWTGRLGIDGYDFNLTASPTPGGDAKNSAHIHWEPGFTYITIEYNPEAEDLEIDLEIDLVHELLHFALRHVGQVLHTDTGIISMLAFEEDVEALAKSLVKMWPRN